MQATEMTGSAAGQSYVQLMERLAFIAGDLEREALDRESKRKDIENRWLKALRAYYGVYDEDTKTDIKASPNKKSELFVKKTRPKTDTWVARIFDLLFPTDDKNWGIKPTPVPELLQLMDQVKSMPEEQQPPQMQDMAEAAEDYVSEADTRAAAMEREINDQLTECRYHSVSRDAIEYGCTLGTAVMKGPIQSGRARKTWVGQGDEYTLLTLEEQRPGYVCVSPWSFFPEPDATSIEESESNFERHLPNKKTLRKWAELPGFNRDAIRELLIEGPKEGSSPSYLTNIRSITQGESITMNNRYVVWEYRGPLKEEDFRTLFAEEGMRNNDQEWETKWDDMEFDPLTEVNVVLYVCQGKILKFGINHLDSDECIYSVWNFAKDMSSIWGWGVPDLMMDSQRALNAAWRMILDNGSISTGPQIVIDKENIEPVDQSYTIEAFKLWYKTGQAPDGSQPFEVFDIPSRQTELANIITLADRFIDEEVSLPMISQGEQGAQKVDGVGGLAMLMNSANVIFRRVIKNWDDDMTVPNIRRLYDFNMQFSDKQEIKGDMQVDARGSSVLLIREVQSQNLLNVLDRFSQHPVLADWTKIPETYRKAVQSMHLPADDIVKSKEQYDEELKEAQERAAQNPPVPSPEEIKLQVAQLEYDAKGRQLEQEFEIERMKQETEMIRLAAAQDMKMDELEAKLQLQKRAEETKERIFAAEAGFKARQAAEMQKPLGEVAGTRYPA